MKRIVERVRRIAEVGARIIGGVAIGAAIALILAQYVRLGLGDVALARQLADARADVGQLQTRRDQQLADIARLHDERGAIPEIHRLLGLFAPGEQRVFLKGPDGVVRPEESSP